LQTDSVPELAELQWLTSSSRDSSRHLYRHLYLDGYSHVVAIEILEWNNKPRTIRFGIFQWTGREGVTEVIKLIRLNSLQS